EAAIEDLIEADATYPPIDRAVLQEYMEVNDILDGGYVGEVRPLPLMHYLPGEESRARKALDVAAAIVREDIDRIYQHQPPRAWVSDAVEYLLPERVSAWRAAMTSPAV